MKVSKSAKEKTKEKIIQSAVELIVQKGYKNSTLRDIAKEAGVSNPTIYNYFATKEKLLYAYVELKHKQAIEILYKIEDFHTYTLREQLQTLIETELELYLEDREFVAQIADMVFESNGINIRKMYDTNALFLQTVEEMIDIAIEANEIASPTFKEHLPTLFWDYYIMVVAYWLQDDSEMFENTTQFIDHSLGLMEAVLHSDILNKASELGMFLFKTHMLSQLHKFSTQKHTLDKVKRKLGDILHG
jgi:AcrR family transcriptional regulator